MAFTRPVVGADISAADFGQPVYDMLTANAQSAWVNLSLLGGWQNVGGSRPASRVCKFGNFGVIHFAIANGAWGAAGALSIPAGYRPVYTCDFVVRQDSGLGWANVSPGGVLELYQGPSSGAGYVAGVLVYPLT